MRHQKRIAIPLALIVALALIGCAAKTTTTTAPAAATDPRVLVAQYCQVGADAASVASKGFIAAHQTGALSDSSFAAIASAIKAADSFFRQATAETASGDSWTVARVKIAGIGASVAIQGTVSDPTLQAELNAINSAIQQVLGVQ